MKKTLIIIAVAIIPFVSFADILTLTNNTNPATPIKIKVIKPRGVKINPVIGLNKPFTLLPGKTASFAVDKKILNLGSKYSWFINADYLNYNEHCQFRILDLQSKTCPAFSYEWPVEDPHTKFIPEIGNAYNNFTLYIEYLVNQPESKKHIANIHSV